MGTRDYIDTVGVWDGCTYEDEFFCKGACAQAYAYMLARSPKNSIRSVAYVDAIERARTGEAKAAKKPTPVKVA